jgi:hypothetical protein
MVYDAIPHQRSRHIINDGFVGPSEFTVFIEEIYPAPD